MRRAAPIVGVIIVVLAVITTATTPTTALAQEPKFEEFHTWWDIATIYNFNDHFRYDGDYGTRGVLSDDYWSLLYLRPSVSYRSKPWMSLHGGAALFYNFLSGEPDLPELRPWAGIRFGWPNLGGFKFTNYFRLELRAFYLQQNSDWEIIWRGRYQLGVTTPRFAIGSAERFFGLASAEIFDDLNDSAVSPFGDRWRINFGIGKMASAALRVELSYLFHKVRLVDTTGRAFEVDDHVVRLRLFYSSN